MSETCVGEPGDGALMMRVEVGEVSRAPRAEARADFCPRAVFVPERAVLLPFRAVLLPPPVLEVLMAFCMKRMASVRFILLCE